MTTFRYQPVILPNRQRGPFVWMCPVYIHESGVLQSWAEFTGDDLYAADDAADLAATFANLYVDARRWKPVRYEELKPGMAFERIMSEEDEEALRKILA